MPSPHHLFPEKAFRTLVAVLANRMREKTLSNATFQGVILCKAGSLRGHVGSRSQTQHLLYAIKPITSCGVVQFAVRQTLYKSRAKWHIRNQGHAPGSEAQSGPQGPPGPGGRLAHGSGRATCERRGRPVRGVTTRPGDRPVCKRPPNAPAAWGLHRGPPSAGAERWRRRHTDPTPRRARGVHPAAPAPAPAGPAPQSITVNALRPAAKNIDKIPLLRQLLSLYT